MKTLSTLLLSLIIFTSCTKSMQQKAETAAVSSADELISTAKRFIYSFDVNKDGWSIYGNAVSKYNPKGGNPGGCMSGIDMSSGPFWYFKAPESFLKKISSHESYNNKLLFDLKAPSSGNTHEPDIILESGENRIVFDLPNDPNEYTWTTYNVQLNDESGWHLQTLDGPLARQHQIKNMLQNLQAMYIRGDYMDQANSNTGFLDNVTYE